MKSAVIFWCMVLAVCSAVSPNWELKQRLERNRIARELRRELEKMGLPEVSRSTPRPSKEALKLMMGQSVEKTEPKADTKSIILPVGGSSDCKRRNNDSTCMRFEYNVSKNVIPSTAKLMVYESGLASHENLTIWAFCLNSNGDGISAQDVLERTNEVENGWLLYSFPVLQQNLTFRKDSTKCGIEISGPFSDESNPPVLLVQKEEKQSRLHKRQAEESPTHCKAIPFSISFRDIAMDHFILYPTGFKAQLCSGTCEGASSTIYEIFMEAAFRNDLTLEDSHGRCWATCCRPKEYQDLRIIYVDDHVLSQITLTDVIAQSCSCS